ncbi:DUF429 domain-containing protein [Salinarchaeum chitinilyticum]
MSSTTGRRRIYGIDFSGAQDAGRNVWLASATRRQGTLVVEGCFPGAALPDSGTDREDCLPALREFLAGADDAIVGMDVPFGLPVELVDADTWPAFAGAFPNGAEGPTEWAEACRDRAETLDRDRVELKRATDEETGAPFSPYNLRMRSSTYYAISSVLAPLVGADAASVLPMLPPNPGVAWLLEACPAVTLDRLDLDAEGYKDDDEAAEERRAEIVDALAEGPATIVPSVRESAIDEPDGDALDAVLAAVGVTMALERGEATSPGTVDARTRIEGKIYA